MTATRKPARRRSARALWVQVHLWLGLTLGIVGALLGLSGSLLVYDDAIDEWLHPQRHAISGAQASLPVAEYARRAEDALASGARATGVRLPDLDEGAVMVFARVRGEGAAFQRVYLDPPTGSVLDTASGRDFLGWLHSFHESLTLREFFGREIVGVIGVGMLISSLTGLYLWWPAGRWRSAVVVFRRGFGLQPQPALHRGLLGHGSARRCCRSPASSSPIRTPCGRRWPSSAPCRRRRATCKRPRRRAGRCPPTTPLRSRDAPFRIRR